MGDLTYSQHLRQMRHGYAPGPCPHTITFPAQLPSHQTAWLERIRGGYSYRYFGWCPECGTRLGNSKPKMRQERRHHDHP